MDVLVNIARANGGVVTRKQAAAAGVGAGLERLARRGLIARIARGVYAVSAMAVIVEPWVVTCASNVVLSHLSAAAWWGVDLPVAPKRMHVTAPRNRGRRRDAVAGVRLHRADLRPRDRCRLRGVPVTTPLRTALDVARHESLECAVSVVDAFFRRGLLDHSEFVGAVRRAAGPGRRRMQLVAQLVDPAAGSVLESLVRVLLWRNRLLPPVSQHLLEHRPSGWRGHLDFAWPALRVALECDGYEWHAAREPFQKDRRRWSTLSRMHWHCGVVTWFDVTADPAYVVRLVADLLGRPAPRRIVHTTVTPVAMSA